MGLRHRAFVFVLVAALTGCSNESSDDVTSGGLPLVGLAAYPFKRELTLSGKVPPSYSIALTFDHAALVKEKIAREDGTDLRVGFQGESELVELDRVVDPMSTWNDAKTTIWFRTPEADVGTGSFSLYFGKLKPPPVLADPSKVYAYWADFDDSFDGTSWKFANFGKADGKSEIVNGALRITGQSQDFGGTSDQGVYFYQSVSGDFTADVAIAGVGGSLGGPSKMGGLMLRENTDVDAAFAMASLQQLPRQRVSLVRKAKAKPAVDGTELMAPGTFPQLLELSRVGNDVSAAYSEDGRTWIGLGASVAMTALAPSVFIGVPFSNISSDDGYADIAWLRIVKRINPAPVATLSATE